MAEKLNLHKLAFIGGGAMGEAIIKGITGAGLMDPAAIFVAAGTRGLSARNVWRNRTR